MAQRSQRKTSMCATMSSWVPETVESILRLGLCFLGLDAATFSQVSGDSVVTLVSQSSDNAPESQEPVSERSVATRLGAPVRLQGRVIGLLEFTGSSPRDRFADSDLRMVESLARWLEHELAVASGNRPPSTFADSPVPAVYSTDPASLMAALRDTLFDALGSRPVEEERPTIRTTHAHSDHEGTLPDYVLQIASLVRGRARSASPSGTRVHAREEVRRLEQLLTEIRELEVGLRGLEPPVREPEPSSGGRG